MLQVNFFFAGWWPILRILVVGTAMYATLVLFLRLSGSRTIASMTVFDFVVTVAIGAAFGGALTSQRIPLAETAAAFALLIGLQYGVAQLQDHWPRWRSVVTNRPSLLYVEGEFQREAMHEERVMEAELRAAVRKRQLGSMEDVHAIVLESAGDLSVITSLGDGSALEDLEDWPDDVDESDDGGGDSDSGDGEGGDGEGGVDEGGG